MRLRSDSWVKLQGAQTEGFLSNVMRSDDGGFGFTGYADSAFAEADAGGYRADGAIGLGRFFDNNPGRVKMYT